MNSAHFFQNVVFCEGGGEKGSSPNKYPLVILVMPNTVRSLKRLMLAVTVISVPLALFLKRLGISSVGVCKTTSRNGMRRHGKVQ